MEFIKLMISSLIFILPAYCANAAPVIFGGGKPLDQGKLFLDGKPLFGNHKTVRGTVSGLLFGILTAAILYYLLNYDFKVGVALSIGTLVGDLSGSFIKRRLNFPPGKPFPVLDQLAFVLFAIGFAYLVSPIKIEVIITVLLLTPIIHVLTNLFAYIFGFKKVPW